MSHKVKVEDVTKIYDLNRSKISKLLSLLSFGYLYKVKPFYALRDINFEVQAGDSIGIIGLNGSGKSTLSDILAEVNQPSSGRIDIQGKSSLIAVNAGLNQELNGYENIRMKCAMHGLTEKQINNRFDEIIEFSELDEFLHQPIKNYSSGMKSKLGFAIAIHTDPDVLIVDEALSVGDETFVDKCFAKIQEFQKRGKTIFFVSHSTSQVKKWCNKVVWIQSGQIKEFGDAEPIIEKYTEFINQFKNLTKDEQNQYKEKMYETQREGDYEAKRQRNKISIPNIIIGLSLFLVFLSSVIIQTLNF